MKCEYMFGEDGGLGCTEKDRGESIFEHNNAPICVRCWDILVGEARRSKLLLLNVSIHDGNELLRDTLTLVNTGPNTFRITDSTLKDSKGEWWNQE